MLQNDIVASAHTSITSHNYCFFFVVKTLTVYSVSNFQACITVLSTVITRLHFSSSELIHLITGGLPCWTSVSLFSPIPPASGNHYSTLCFYEFGVLFFFQILHISDIAQYLSFPVTQHNVFKFHPCCLKQQDFLLSHD